MAVTNLALPTLFQQDPSRFIRGAQVLVHCRFCAAALLVGSLETHNSDGCTKKSLVLKCLLRLRSCCCQLAPAQSQVHIKSWPSVYCRHAPGRTLCLPQRMRSGMLLCLCLFFSFCTDTFGQLVSPCHNLMTILAWDYPGNHGSLHGVPLASSTLRKESLLALRCQASE